jgi:predicted nicotinamide N-methyase
MSSSSEPILKINDKPIHLDEDWEHGIGGGLWTTGLAIAKYLSTRHGQEQLRHRRHVLELGSGNGLLGVCLLAANPQLETVVITDTKDHLPLIEKTLSLNGIDDNISTKVKVEEYMWGPHTSNTPAVIKDTAFDLIIGSDLAYRDYLHDPLIASIVACSSHNTVTLLGVTMSDTKPIFFQKLIAAGLKYERLADHLLEDTFRGKLFGVFVIWKE